MESYDPYTGPQPEDWLAGEESERLQVVTEYHMNAGDDAPNPELHAAIHVIVENQLAEEVPEVVGAYRRLMDAGVDRHETVHAIGSVVAKHIYSVLQGEASEDSINDPYLRDVENLTVESRLNTEK